VQIIYEEYKKNGLNDLEKFVTEKMLDDLCIAGSPNDAIKKLKNFRDIGIDLPIIQFNPIGNVKESFGLLTKTFSGDSNE
jgi:alkanesulfonate monooxygenase SsuD/methylene tetrahydromethanopterin reductase-like flavin-dependent oxidoreductase (luciferase family)